MQNNCIYLPAISVCFHRYLFPSAVPFHWIKGLCRSICSLAPTVLNAMVEASKAAGLQGGQPNFSDDAGSHRQTLNQLHVQGERVGCAGEVL